MSSNLRRVVINHFIRATNGEFLNFPIEEQENMVANVINNLPKETIEYFS